MNQFKFNYSSIFLFLHFYIKKFNKKYLYNEMLSGKCFKTIALQIFKA